MGVRLPPDWNDVQRGYKNQGAVVDVDFVELDPPTLESAGQRWRRRNREQAANEEEA